MACSSSNCRTLGVRSWGRRGERDHPGGSDRIRDGSQSDSLEAAHSKLLLRVADLHSRWNSVASNKTYRWHCSKAPWSPSSWLAARLSSSEQSGTRSLFVRTDRRVRRGDTSSESVATVRCPLTVRVDLRLVFLRRHVREVIGAQAPHVHALRRPRCHGRAQGRGLGHGGSHCANTRQTKHIQNMM